MPAGERQFTQNRALGCPSVGACTHLLVTGLPNRVRLPLPEVTMPRVNADRNPGDAAWNLHPVEGASRGTLPEVHDCPEGGASNDHAILHDLERSTLMAGKQGNTGQGNVRDTAENIGASAGATVGRKAGEALSGATGAGASGGQGTVGNVAQKAQDAASNVAQRAQDMASTAAEKAGQAVAGVAGTMS